jgi:hypothetical protein
MRRSMNLSFAIGCNILSVGTAALPSFQRRLGLLANLRITGMDEGFSPPCTISQSFSY